jgi:hypothetical protein
MYQRLAESLKRSFIMFQQGDFLMTNVAYALYLCLSIGMTIWVARVLSENGKVFLVKCFGQDEELAQSTNRLLVIGFYLVNIGFICTRLSGWRADGIDLIPDVGARVGLSILVLGGMHFFNMFMIAKFGRTVSSWASPRENRQLPANSSTPSTPSTPSIPAAAQIPSDLRAAAGPSLWNGPQTAEIR